MANQIVQLTDSNNNNIFPVAGSMAGGSITTGMIQDGAVTTDKINDGAVIKAKFAQYAVNEAVVTSGNLVPTSDKPKAWQTLLGDSGYWVTPYTTNAFANQPSQYGILETIISTGGVYQRWTKSGSGEIYHRSGLGYSDTDHWWDSSSAAGTFRQIVDNNVATGTFSMETGFAEVSNNSFINKVGNLVTWQLCFTATSAMSAGTEYHVGTISSGFRPSQLTLGSGSTTNGINIGTFVDQDGKIRLIPYANVSSSASRYVGGTYFVN